MAFKTGLKGKAGTPPPPPAPKAKASLPKGSTSLKHKDHRAK